MTWATASGVLAVHVEDRDLEHLGHVRGVRARAAHLRRGREAYLVVHDDADGPAGPVRIELAQVERLLDDAFPGERRVPVNGEDEPALACEVARPILLRAHAAVRDGVHVLEVARVEAEGEVHGLAAQGRPLRAVSEVVLHVPLAAVELGVLVVELAEDRGGALPHDVREDVEPAAMRHREDDLVDALIARLLDGEIEERDQAFRSLAGEGLRPGVLALDEGLEDDGIREPRQDAELLLPRELDPVPGGLHAVPEPPADGQVVDVHVLDPDGSAVRAPEVLQDLPETELAPTGDRAAREDAVHVRLLETVVGGVQLGLGLDGTPQRIEARDPVPAHAIRADELVDAVLEMRRPLGRAPLGPGRRRVEDAPGREGRAGVGGSTVGGGEAVEVGPPVLGDGARVPDVPLEEILDEGEVRGAREPFGFVHG